MEAGYFNFDPDKNAVLKQERGVSFDDVILAIQEDCLLDIIEHPNQEEYGHQRIYIVEIDRYVYAVPFVESGDGVFLKTVFPSRKLTKQYIGEWYEEEIS